MTSYDICTEEVNNVDWTNIDIIICNREDWNRQGPQGKVLVLWVPG